MLRRATVVSFLTALVVAPAATAGGWWSGIEVDPSRVAIGQRVTAEADVLFSSKGVAATAADDGEFYVYLLRDFDYAIVERAMNEAVPKDWWSVGDAEAVEVGRVTLDVVDANLARARASFTVRELPLGPYALMFCDAGCTRPLADVVPTPGLSIVADPMTARLAKRVERLEKRVARQARRLAAHRAALDAARLDARNSRSDVERLEAEIGAIERRVADADRGASPWAYGGWTLAAVVAAALGLLLGRRTGNEHVSVTAPVRPRIPAGPRARARLADPRARGRRERARPD